MTARLPFDAHTSFCWSMGGQDVAASAVAALGGPRGLRAVLKDTEDRYWLAGISADGRLMEIIAGPVDLSQAINTAEFICAGGHDHGSVTGLVNTLSIALAARS